MSQPAPIHICFYSSRCQWSKAFIEEIARTKYVNDFRFICVDPGPNRPALPSWLKQTPTLVIRGESEPRVDSEVMNWLYEQRLRDGAGHQGGTGGPVEPDPYMDMEMGSGFAGDFYSFLGADTSAQGDGGAQMRHNFTYLNGQDAVGTREASTFQSTNSTQQKRSKKEQLLDQQMEMYMKDRDAGMPKQLTRQ